jgi:hypothetical protein
MCAGKGIIHAEMPVYIDGAPDPRGLQLWVDLPKEVCYTTHTIYSSTEYFNPSVQDGGMFDCDIALCCTSLRISTTLGSIIPRTPT